MRKYICSPEYELTDIDKLTMITFYETMASVQFDNDMWVPFRQNQQSPQ